MIVMKFGGTSVGSADAIRRVGEIVAAARERSPVVVVSAVSGVTDRLIQSAQQAERREASSAQLMTPLREKHAAILRELALPSGLLADELLELADTLHGIWLLRELSPRSLDFALSFGELMSSKIVAAHLGALGLEARAWSGWEAGVLTDDAFGEAALLPSSYERLAARLGAATGRPVPVITGFLGGTASGERTTLGRGGSDYSAAIVARALGAEEIQIWTDVAGIMSCDPRVVPDAFTVRYLTFAEASELAFFGARVLHPRTVEPALEAGIALRILNTFDPDDAGTLVVHESHERSERPIEGLAFKRGNLMVNLESTRMLDSRGYLAEIFGVLARHGISVDCLASSEVSVSLTVEGRFRAALEQALGELGAIAHTQVFAERAVVCAVGEGMRERTGIAGEIFGVLGREKVNVELISQGPSEINVTFVVKDADAERAVRALHDHFLRGRQRTTLPEPERRWLGFRRKPDPAKPD